MKDKKHNKKKAILWFIINGSMFFLAYLGFAEGKEWAGNVFKFSLWLVTILYIIGFFANIKEQKKDRSVPKKISLIFDLSLALFLASFGMFFYASLQIVQMLAFESLYAEKPEKESNKIRSEVRKDSSGDVDEVLLYVEDRCVFHLETMSDQSIWFALYPKKDLDNRFWISSKNGRSHIEIIEE